MHQNVLLFGSWLGWRDWIMQWTEHGFRANQEIQILYTYEG